MAVAWDFPLSGLDGAPLDLKQYEGRVLLIVNTASQCGFTPQYQGLEELHRQFSNQGLVVLGCPCNQFGAQEPGAAAEIGAFCEKNYGVSFPLTQKIDVNGVNADPLFAWLKQSAPGILGSQAIKWNFTKFLVRKNGAVFKRYAPLTAPRQLKEDIASLLAE